MTARTCGWCGAYANQQPIEKQHEVSRDEVDVLCQRVFVCQACQMLSVATYGMTPGAGYVKWEAVYAAADWVPIRGQKMTVPDLPADITETTREAYTCLTVGAHRACVTLVRSLIEATAKSHGITVHGVQPKINAMADKGLIHPSLARAANAVRVIANDSVHGDLQRPVTKQDAEDALEVLIGIFAATFQSEARVRRLTERQTANAGVESAVTSGSRAEAPSTAAQI